MLRSSIYAILALVALAAVVAGVGACNSLESEVSVEKVIKHLVRSPHQSISLLIFSYYINCVIVQFIWLGRRRVLTLHPARPQKVSPSFPTFYFQWPILN